MKNSYKIILLTVLILGGILSQSLAVNLTWTNASADGKWGTASNWGTGVTHRVPTSVDAVIFGGAGGSNTACNMSLVAVAHAASITISATYTSTITQGDAAIICAGSFQLNNAATWDGTTGTGNGSLNCTTFKVSAGTFKLGCLAVTAAGTCTISGTGTFNGNAGGGIPGTFSVPAYSQTGVSTSFTCPPAGGLFTVSAAFTFNSGSFLNNGGAVTLNPSSNISITGSPIFNDLTFDNSVNTGDVTLNVVNTITVNGTLTFLTDGGSGAGTTILNTGTVNVAAGITLTNLTDPAPVGGAVGTATMVLDGGVSQTINTANAFGSMTAIPDLAMALPNVTINEGASAAIIDLSADATGVTIAGTLTVAGSGNITLGTAASRQFSCLGNVTVTNTNATANTSAGTVALEGTVAQTLTGSGTAGQGNLPNILFANTSAVTSLSSVISTVGNWTNNTSGAGSVDAITGGSTVVFDGAGAQSVSGTSVAVPAFNSITFAKPTGTFTVGATLNVAGDWNNNNTGSGAIDVTTNSSNVNFNGAGAQAIAGTAGTNSFYDITFVNTGGAVTPAGTVNVSHNWINNNTGGSLAGGTSTVVFNGSVGQAIGGSVGNNTFNNITFANTGGAVTLNGTLFVGGNWTNNNTLGTIDAISASSIVNFNGAGAQTTGGSSVVLPAFYTVTFTKANGTFTLGATTNVAGDWNVNNTGSGAIDVTTNSSTVNFNGTGAQAIGGSVGTDAFNNITFTNTGGTVTLNGIVNVASNWTNNNVAPGTVDAVTALSTVNFNGAGAQALGGSSPAPSSFYNITFTKATGTFTLGSLIDVAGSWTNNNTGSGAIDAISAAGTVNFNGTGAQTIGGSSAVIPSFYNLTFTKTTGTFTMGATTNVAGNWNNNNSGSGAIDVATNSSTVAFNGNAAQTIGGSAAANVFYNLKGACAAGGSITISATPALTVTNLLQLDATNPFTLTTNSNLTLVSNAGTTAYVDVVTAPSNLTITGPVNVQRYLGASTTGWANMSSCGVVGQTFSSWGAAFAVTCPANCPNGATASGSAFNSVTGYDQSQVSGSAAEYPNAIPDYNTAIMQNGVGYWVYRGNTAPAAATGAVTMSDNGPIQVGNGSIALAFSGGNADQGTNLIGNPYTAPVSWNALRAGVPAMSNSYFVWNPNYGSGGDVFFDGVVSNPTAGAQPGAFVGDAIPMGQAFAVMVTAPSTINYTESMKSVGTNSALRTVAQTVNVFTLAIDGGPKNLHDELETYFSPLITTPGKSSAGGALKRYDSDINTPNISCIVGGNNLCINANPPLAGNVSFPVKTLVYVAGTYTIQATAFGDVPAGNCVTLYDNLLGTTTDLRQGGYTCTLSDTNTVIPRFTLNILFTNTLALTASANQPTCPNTSNGKIVAIGNAPGPWDYSWVNPAGVVVRTSLAFPTADSLTSLAAGTYTVNVHRSGSCGDNASQIFAISNPATPVSVFTCADTTTLSGGPATMSMTNTSANATNYFWNFGNNTSSTSAAPTASYNAPGVYTVHLSAINGPCSDTTYSQKVIHVVLPLVTGINIAGSADNLVVISQDATGTFVKFANTSLTRSVISVYNVAGQKVTADISVTTLNEQVYLNLGEAHNQTLLISVQSGANKTTTRIFNK
jgi:hypothetical protein